MTMFALPILASDLEDTQMQAALAAGWRRCDLHWERLQEAGNESYLAGDIAQAARAWKRAAWIARLRFSTDDPRRVPTLSNLALLERAHGREARARKGYAKAAKQWRMVDGFIENMTIARRARSSLFHLRMEALHWDTYTDNARKRFRAFADETTAALSALESAEPVDCRLFERWRGEKPSVFDDTRKFLAAALMIGGGRSTNKTKTNNQNSQKDSQ